MSESTTPGLGYGDDMVTMPQLGPTSSLDMDAVDESG